MNASTEYDIVVIGGGGSGYAAASTAAKRGARVAMVEGDRLGGTCLNVGCVPTKALVRTAQVLETSRRAAEFGVRVGEVTLDFGAAMQRQRRIIAEFSGEGPLESLRDQGIALIRGCAAFEDARTLRIGETLYRPQTIVVATGSAPVIPDIPGLAGIGYVTSDGILDLEELPESLLIVGGGIIGCEFASIFNAFGSRVSIVGSALLAREDADVGKELAGAFERRGIEVLGGSRAVGFRREGGKTRATVRFEDGRAEERAADTVLVAVGRRPRHDGLNIERAEVRLDARGGVVVGEDMATSAGHVWACGDVTGMHMYTHAGDAMGEAAGWNAAGGAPKRVARLDVVPRPVYGLPEVAAVGLTEREARRLGCDMEVARVRYADISRAVIDGETEGWCRIIAERSTGRILGAAIVGAGATELIGEVVLAMTGAVSAWTLGDTLHPYPTVSEIVRWTADQIGRSAERGEEPDVRRTLYTDAPCELLVEEAEQAADGPVTEERMRAASEPRCGYGEGEEAAIGASS